MALSLAMTCPAGGYLQVLDLTNNNLDRRDAVAICRALKHANNRLLALT